MCSGADVRVLGEAEVVVGAHVQDFTAVLETNHGILSRSDEALVFISACRADCIELCHDMLLEIGRRHCFGA